jgi:general secretion pathway protein K
MKAQRGAAILTAMLTVVLVATLAASTLWQQWRGVEVESAERARTQSGWVLAGALDWARLILREDARKGGADHLAEPWAVPLASARLSSFLAADRSDALAADATQDAFLSGQITDLQSRLNTANLVQDGKIHAPSRLAFARLFKLLNLPAHELALLADNLLLAQASGGAAPGPDKSPAASAAAPLLPQDLDQLAWLGLSARTLALLRPFVTVLPERTPVNLNTAPVEVIYACVKTFDVAAAHAFVNARNLTHVASLQDAFTLVGGTAAEFNEAQHSTTSHFFEVRGQLQIEQTRVQAQSVVQRVGLEVKTLWQKYGVAPVIPLLQ